MSPPLWAQEAYRVKGSGEEASTRAATSTQPSAISIPSLLNQAASQAPARPLLDSRLLEKTLSAEAKSNFINHGVFGAILKKYVSKSGWFNYRALSRHKKDQERLKAYVRELAEINPSSLEDPRDRMASWLNLYNALVIQEILENYPVKSIGSIKRFMDAKRLTVGGKEYSLLDLEEEIFRLEFNNPRVVFARVNGSSSGPRLRREPFEAATIDEQLEESVLKFLRDPANLYYEPKKKILGLSGIFALHEKEFGEVTEFLSAYLNLPRQRYQIVYRGYDFRLNDVRLH